MDPQRDVIGSDITVLFQPSQLVVVISRRSTERSVYNPLVKEKSVCSSNYPFVSKLTKSNVSRLHSYLGDAAACQSSQL